MPTDAAPAIACIRFSSLGDIVLTTPVFRAVKNRYPQARVTMVTKRRYRELVEEHPLVDEKIFLDTRHEHKGVSGFLRFARDLNRKGFDHVIDLHGSLRSRILTGLLKHRTVTRYDSERARRKLVVGSHRARGKVKHTAEKYLEALRGLDIPVPEKIRPRVYVPAADSAWAESFLAPRTSGRPLAGVNVGARWPTKQWPLERCVELVRQLAPDTDVILFGNARDRESLEELEAKSGQTVINTLGQLSLGQLMGLISQCRVLVTADSGPMHIATGLGVPVVALFGPTHPDLGFAPLGPGNTVICRDYECSPCSLHGKRACRYGDRHCLTDISAEEAARAVMHILHTGSADE